MTTEDFLRMTQTAREQHGITNEAGVAKLLNVSEQVINNWKRRGLPQNKVIDIAQAIGCNAIWLRDGDDNTNPNGLQILKNTLQQDLHSALANMDSDEAEVWKSRLESAEAEVRRIKAEMKRASNQARRKQEESNKDRETDTHDPPQERRRAT